jgi:hypothetical protein
MLGRHADDDTSSKRKKVTVSFDEGGAACTDGNNVTMPADISDRVADEAMAIAAHERYGHGGFTNFTKYQSVCKKEPWLQPVLNALEDVRVDHRVMTRFPQYSHFYKRLLEYIKKTQADKNLDLKTIDPKMKVLLEIIYRSYPDSVKDGVNAWTSDEDTLKWIEDNKDFVDDLISRAQDPKSTTEKMYAASQELFKKLWGDPPDNGDDGEGGDNGEDGDCEGEGEGGDGINNGDGDGGGEGGEGNCVCDCHGGEHK